MSDKKKKPRKPRVQSNIKRCPYLKITKKTTNKETGEVTVIEEFNDCYKSFCMAWDDEVSICRYLQRDLEEDEDEDEDDD
jgi:hypothetical protein